MNGTTAENPSAINPAGESPPAGIPAASAATLSVGEQALAAHNATSPKRQRKRGRPQIHGRYARVDGDPVPLGKVDNGTGPILLEETQPPVNGAPGAAPVEIGTEGIEKPFDEAVNRQYAALIVSGLVGISNSMRRGRIIKRTGNSDLADFVELEKKPLSDAPKEAMETGLTGMARKYGVDLSKTPEGIFIGGLLLWQTEERASTAALIAKYEKLRPLEKTP